MKKLSNEINTIEGLFINYVEGYKKSALKRREMIDSLYKFSTLHNFHYELGVT